ncbi:MAG: Gfo/Idh/MocA family oxidoreductase [Acidobacteria bacterium]|nr:Gfo/Idh/MocA family oxidoreductase [Acidobacteriota bacterium]
MADETSRRNFLTRIAGTGVGLMLARRAGAARRGGRSAGNYRPPGGFAAPPLEEVSMAFVGVGLQGGSHVHNFMQIPRVRILAICDIDGPRAAEVGHWVAESGQAAPDLYTRGDEDFRRLCERGDIDLVFNSTPWRWHVPVCLAAMSTGKHVAVEVPAAYRVEDCWQLVETAERTRRHCVMMENCSYGRSELMVLNMVRHGLFGELLHGEGAYIHDLREIKFGDKNEGLWRLEHSIHRNGNLYPTHGLGPIAQCMDINRGDQFDYMVSMSSNARGLALYAREHLQEGDSRRRAYALGDMNTSIIKTKRGRTIVMQHDTTTPRPYSRINLIQGTRGCYVGYPDRIHIEGRTEGDDWEDGESYREEFDHPLWQKLEQDAEGAGHGGMDYLEDYRLIEALLAGEPTDMDVYDAAALSAVIEISEKSVASRAKTIEIPDFTRGRWKSNLPLGIVG